MCVYFRTAFPSIQSILSVTGTFDVDKFNKGFEEGISAPLSVAVDDKPTQEEAPESIERQELSKDQKETEEIQYTRTEKGHKRPLSLWFKKQLVLKSIQERKMDLTAFGYSGK